MKIKFLLFFLVSFSVSAQVQDSISINEPKEILYDYDSSQKIVKFDSEKIREYKEDSDFSYVEVEQTDSTWIQLKNWLSQIFSDFFKWLFGVNEFSSFWKVFFTLIPYILIIAALFLLGWLFMRVNPKDILLEKQQASQVLLTEDEDIIQNQDIGQLIHKALQNENYRLAIRYYYLHTLKRLSDTEHIEWESQKTNTDYIKELADDSLKKQFRNITRLYDFIWYGNFEVDEKSFLTAEQKFKSLTNRLKT